MLLASTVAVVVALAPIAHVLATDLAASMRGAGVNSGIGVSKLRRGLLTTQTALSVTLLVGAGLFIRSLWNVRHLDLGVQPERVLVANVGWPNVPNKTPSIAAAEKTRRANAFRQLRGRIAVLPGVSHAALAIGSPFGFGFGVDVKIPGRDTLPSAPGGGPYINAVGQDYFATAGTPLVRGRVFDESDGPGTPRVAIVNQTMASLVWPNQDPLGKCIIVEDTTTCATIVGIVRDARRDGINEPATMQFYVPVGQEAGIGGTVLLVRPTGHARAFEQTLRRAIIAAEPHANYLNISLMQDRVDPQLRPWRLGATMFGVFGALALIVAAVGLYSVIAYGTAQRAHEFGIRLAIGSSGGRLARAVLAEGLRVAVVGVAVGGLVALIAGRRIAPLLFHVSPTDPVVYAVVGGVLVVAAIVASLVPAVKASRTDPVIALRAL
jgi:predicted permease